VAKLKTTEYRPKRMAMNSGMERLFEADAHLDFIDLWVK
jgi:hypothetical protein